MMSNRAIVGFGLAVLIAFAIWVAYRIDYVHSHCTPVGEQWNGEVVYVCPDTGAP